MSFAKLKRAENSKDGNSTKNINKIEIYRIFETKWKMEQSKVRVSIPRLFILIYAFLINFMSKAFIRQITAQSSIKK
jgi:hypothetical protein